MALKFEDKITLTNTLSDVYGRVENITMDKSNMSFVFKKYETENSKSSYNEERHSCIYDINNENPFKQAYNYLKSLEDYSNATDC